MRYSIPGVKADATKCFPKVTVRERPIKNGQVSLYLDKLFVILTFMLSYIRSHILYGCRGTVAFPPLTGRNILEPAEEPAHFSRSIKAHAK